MAEKQTRESAYPQHVQHLTRRATAKPSRKRYARKRKHRDDDRTALADTFRPPPGVFTERRPDNDR